jgi:uncharacterized protein YjbJ (UPF0337 family)
MNSATATKAVSRATDDEGFELEGKIEQVVGHLKQAGEKVKEPSRAAGTARSTGPSPAGPH